jgi:nucleotide-binding universal stress UspA family protein
MNTIIVGVDASEHSEDAIAFASTLGRDSNARVVVACAFRPDDSPRPVRDPEFQTTAQQQAQQIAWRMSHRLEGIEPGRIRTCAVEMSSRDHGLHELAASEAAAIVIVGASHAGSFAHLLPSGIGARLLHDAAFAVAVIPDGYRTHADQPIRRIGVAYDGSAESRAALVAAVAAVHAFGGELEVITVLSARVFATPTMMGGPGYINVDEEFGREAREELDTILAGLPGDLLAEGTILDGRPAHQLTRHTKRLDLLLLGSRGYNPLHALLADGVSGRVLRDAHCPVIAVPRGAEAPLEFLAGSRPRTSGSRTTGGGATAPGYA